MSEPRTTSCARCGEVMPIRHDCAMALEARALFEAARRANSKESARSLADAAYKLAEAAEL